MRYRLLTLFLLGVLTFSCTEKNDDSESGNLFFARIESASDPETKVYADDKLRVLWDAEDRVSIFNKYTYNQEYRFTGNSGDNSGAFSIVQNDDFVTGNELSLVYAVYPYQKATSINNDGVLTVTLPAEQTYRDASFGRGANTMVSCTTNNQLLFKNVCGYLGLKLYGEDVSVSSISIKGNKGEALAGTASVVSATDAVPTLSLSTQTMTEITLRMDEPVRLGTTAENASAFWLVVPPVTFEAGFTLTVKDNKGNSFEKATTKPFSISRNTLSRMSALKVNLENTSDPVEMTLAEMTGLADGTSVKTKPVQVMAKTKRGLILADDSRTLLLYAMTGFEDIAVGDIIQATSTFIHYRELPELSGIEAIEKISSGNTPTYPTPTDITDRSDFDDDFFKDFQYIRLNGTLQSIRSNDIGISYFVKRSADDGLLPFNIFYPFDYQNPENYSVGDNVWAEGYFAGFNSTDICIVITTMAIEPQHPVAVDMGLSVKWSSCCLGATKPEEYNKDYTWGAVLADQDGGTYPWGDDDSHPLKYNSTDKLSVLLPEDDAATVAWGDLWRIPTLSEVRELTDPDNCTWTPASRNGVKGFSVVSKITGNQIFMPVGPNVDYACMWTSSIGAINGYSHVMNYSYESGGPGVVSGWRSALHGIRPVYGEWIHVQKITLNQTKTTMEAGETLQLSVSFSPENAFEKNLFWSSSDEMVATVSDQGVVTAKKAGTATITATTVDGGLKSSCSITVPSGLVDITGITLNRSSLELTEGEQFTLTATVTPDNATDKTVSWTSSNPSVASVSDGTVIAVSAGSATITATAGNIQATCTVTVAQAYKDTAGPSVVSFTLSPESVDVTDQDQSVTITVRLTDETGVQSGFCASAYFPDDVDGTMQQAGFQLVSGDKKDGSYKATLTMKKGSVAGDWVIKLADLKDELGNPAEEKTKQLKVVNNQSGTGTGGDWTDPGDD